jgi:hypothetical protein
MRMDNFSAGSNPIIHNFELILRKVYNSVLVIDC